MTPEDAELLEPYHQEIGRLALEVADETATRVLVYAEFDADGLTADLFFDDPEDPDTVQYRLCPPMLEAVIEAYWDAARQLDPKGEWATLAYVIENDAFRVELKYPEEIDEHEDEDISDRRPAAVAAVFGPALVDYSRPGA
ncbi:MAG TPA: hypothetical protein VEA44_19090 [Caulobacter sp.]|nr:hypothetical protein [Caulobacter sp.]